MYQSKNVQAQNRQQYLKAKAFLQIKPYQPIQQINQPEDSDDDYLMRHIAQNNRKNNIKVIEQQKKVFQTSQQYTKSYNNNQKYEQQKKRVDYKNMGFKKNQENFNTYDHSYKDGQNYKDQASYLNGSSYQNYTSWKNQQKYQTDQSDKNEAGKLKTIQFKLEKQKQKTGRVHQLFERKKEQKSIQRNHPQIRNYRIGVPQQWESIQNISDSEISRILRNFRGVKSFKNNQKAIIKCSLMQQDVFVCMPTGGGKSLTFQFQTFFSKGIYLCILPLISLIVDQEQQARQIGIQAYSITGSISANDVNLIYSKINNYSLDKNSIVIFATPQKVNLSNRFVQVLNECYRKGCLIKIVIDEVHCVSTWGRQFRKQYQNLRLLRQNFPKTPILALTATVTEVIKQDIINRLQIKNCFFFQSSFNRPNLFYQVRPKTKSTLEEIDKIMKQHKKQSGIIYCLSKKECQDLCQNLRKKGYKVQFYHAGLGDQERRVTQQKWMKGIVQVIVATIAFGMGINKPDVRFVIHYSLSKSLENYYQESGRAGRDGLEAICILFYRNSDKKILQTLTLKNQYSTMQNKDFCSKQLNQMIRYCQDTLTCRRKFQLAYLGEQFDAADCLQTCDNCLKGLAYEEVQCINQAKIIVKTLIVLEQVQNFTIKQLCCFCLKGKLKNKNWRGYQLIQENGIDNIDKLFKDWSVHQVEMLVLELINRQIVYERAVCMQINKNNKNDVISNLYLKCNKVKAKKLMETEQMKIKKQKKHKNEKKMMVIEDQEDDDTQLNLLLLKYANIEQKHESVHEIQKVEIQDIKEELDKYQYKKICQYLFDQN